MIKQLSLFNFMCFRGMHKIDLGPKPYAITCQYESDRSRSNFGGKSAIFEAIKFALSGKLNKDRRFDADGWITRGEKEGAVALVLEGDVAIKRERTRGKSTQVRFSTPKMGPATQDQADAEMVKYLHFDYEDFETVSYFAQGMMSRIIRTEPEKRFDIIRGWLNLDKAEEAESRSQDIVIAKVRELQKLKARYAILEERLSPRGDKVPNSDEHLAELEAERVELKKKVDKLEKKKERYHERESLQSFVDRFDDIIQRGKALTAEIDAYPKDLREKFDKEQVKLKEKYATYIQASRDTASKRTVASGQFDGKCPIAGIQCPATKQINADRETSIEIYNKAQRIEKKAKVDYDDIRPKVEEYQRQIKELDKKETLRNALREEASEIRDDMISAKKKLEETEEIDIDAVETKLNTLYDQIENINSDIATNKELTRQRTELIAERDKVKAEMDVLVKEAATATQTRTIFRVTQRRVAEQALHAIGSSANATLLNAGVDLKLQVQWEREGKNLAKNCDTCGMAFPSSAKVKTCESCGAERGQNIIQRLDFLLSDRSGAADDFAGIALQLAAGSWLLRARESGWATALLDEPLSQMDRSLRRAAAKHLLNMLGNTAYKQLLVISHDEHSVEMFPNRINIVVGKDGRRRIETIG